MARLLIEVPSDVLGLVLYQLPLAHDIARTGLTCHALCDAAKLALKARPFSGEVVTLAGHVTHVLSVAAAPDGRIITGSTDHTVKVWRDGACERTLLQAHPGTVVNVAVLPGGARFVSVSEEGPVKLWALDGALEHTFMDESSTCVTALPDGVHLWSAPTARSGCTTSTARSSTPSRGTPTLCTRWR